MLLYSGHYFPACAGDHGCWAEYTTTVSSVSSTDSASHSGKKLCCYTQGTTSQPQAQTMVVGQSIPQKYPQSPAQSVPPTQVRNYVVILRALLPRSEAQPQTMVVGQSIPQQYPQSPAQTVPPTAGKKLCCYTLPTTSQPEASASDQVVGQSIPQQYPQSPAQTVPPTAGKKLCCYTQGTTSQPWGWASDHGCWAEYTTTVILSLPAVGVHCLCW